MHCIISISRISKASRDVVVKLPFYPIPSLEKLSVDYWVAYRIVRRLEF